MGIDQFVVFEFQYFSKNLIYRKFVHSTYCEHNIFQSSKRFLKLLIFHQTDHVLQRFNTRSFEKKSHKQVKYSWTKIAKKENLPFLPIM